MPPSGDRETQSEEAPLRRLLAALPQPVRRSVEWIRQPERIWMRVPLAILLIAGGILGFLPILGFWMVPLGIVLLADDIPFLRRPAMRALGAVQAWWDRRQERHGRE